MLIFDAGIFADAIDDVVRLEGVLSSPDGWIDKPDNKQYFQDKLSKLSKEIEQLGLRTSLYKSQQIFVTLKNTPSFKDNASICSLVQQYCKSLRENLHIELAGRKFYGPLPGYEKYYNQVELFGPEVFKAFSSANEDIYEAGMCLALERGTACVMHLMRVHEAGLKALAHVVGVGDQNDWGSYIREIHSELDKRAKTAGARTPDELFYSETASSIDRLKRAYRNPTMHPEKTYSPERAEQILLATKEFMGVLAGQISEAAV